jgi:hypothetical protein
MQGAGTIGAEFTIPAITIASDPGVKMLGGKVNSGHEQQPRDQLPAGQRQPNTRPGVCAGVNAPAWVDRLHQTHGFVEINLRKARGNSGVMQVQEFDAAGGVHEPDAGYAGAAQVAGSIVEHGELGHDSPRRCIAPKTKVALLELVTTSSDNPEFHSNK